jgi:Uma2 family endonuclease
MRAMRHHRFSEPQGGAYRCQKVLEEVEGGLVEMNPVGPRHAIVRRLTGRLAPLVLEGKALLKDALRVGEVADTSLRHDLSTKLPYAQGGVPEVWGVDLEGQGAPYGEVETLRPAFLGVEIPMEELL